MNAIALIELCDGSAAIVDQADLSLVADFDWTTRFDGLARMPIGRRCAGGTVVEAVYLHRLIADAGPDDVVYHRNHDTLDNRRENLVVIGHASLHPVLQAFHDDLRAD